MLLPLKLIPELRSVPPEGRRDRWRRALRDPFRISDLFWLLLVLLLTVTTCLWQRHMNMSGWLGEVAWSAIFFMYVLVLDLVMILRYRPVLRRLER